MKINLISASKALSGPSEAEVKSALEAAGLQVKVKDLGDKFRVTPKDAGPFSKDQKATLIDVAKALGLIDAFIVGRPGGMFNGAAEFVAYRQPMKGRS